MEIVVQIILVPGTWANERGAPKDEWWKPGSPFWSECVNQGKTPTSFPWDTDLEGVIGLNDHWIRAGSRLCKIAANGCVIVAHSHGGQVAVYAAAMGLKIKTLITLATPVRPDVPYDKARVNIDRWVHCYGDYEDYVQILGELMLFRFWKLRRSMPLANYNLQFSGDHSSLHYVTTWNKMGWWKYLA